MIVSSYYGLIDEFKDKVYNFMSNPDLTLEHIEEYFEEFESFALKGTAKINGYKDSVYSIVA